MADKAKGPVVILIILLLVAIAAAALSFYELQKAKGANQELSEQNNQLEAKKKAVEKQITDLNAKMNELKLERDMQQAKIQEYESKISSFQEEINTADKAKEEALEEAARAKAEIQSLKTAKAGLESELRSSKELLSSFQEKVASLEKSQDTLSQKQQEAQAKSQSQDVQQLEKIVVTAAQDASLSAASAASGPAAEGKVLVVNKEYDFVVVNLGQKDNITISDTLEVFRNNKKIGEMRVEEVRDAMSVATPSAKDIIKQIKEDDRVVRKAG